MEATTQVKLESLAPYLHLFPKALGKDQTVKMGATVSDTVNFIPQIIRKTAWQVEQYVEQELQGLPVYKACEKLWYFVKYHIKYEPDERGIEQVRSPRRFIWDKKGDCDCGTTYIGTCIFSLAMKGLKGVRSLILRITKYKKDYFQHIYPVVRLTDGTEIILDFVVHQFNYEEPYTEKKDYTMELQFLDGIEDKNLSLMGKDVEQILGTDSDLGKLLKRAAKKSGGGSGSGGAKKPGLFKKKTPEQKQAKKEKRKETIKKVGKGVKKGLNVVNKVNPATVLLRAGILASMKMNVMKVAENLRWAYAPRELAQSKGMDMSKYDKLKNVLKKTEDIFYAAGGKPENLRKAILTGRGNRSKEVVAGLGELNETTTLPQILGALYHDEFVNGMEGFEGIEGTDGLGSAAAAGASMAAASSTMGALAVLIKAIGSLFPNKGKTKKGKKGAADAGTESAEYTEPGGEEPSAEESPAEPEAESTEAPEESSDNLPAAAEETAVTTSEEESEPPAETPEEETTEGLGGLASIKDFFEKNGKTLLISAGVAAIAVTAVALISRHVHKKKEEQKQLPQPQRVPAINGVPKKRNKRKKGGNRHDLDGTETVVALM